jgi:hypothetical protein
MKIVYIVAAVVALLLLLAAPAGFVYYEYIANPRVVRELVEEPGGERAQKVMLITLPSGRRIPVNYLREGNRVYAAADGTWWKELDGSGAPVIVLVRGEALTGIARAVRDDPAHTKDVFSRLRPNAVEGFGTLVEVEVEP